MNLKSSIEKPCSTINFVVISLDCNSNRKQMGMLTSLKWPQKVMQLGPVQLSLSVHYFDSFILHWGSHCQTLANLRGLQLWVKTQIRSSLNLLLEKLYACGFNQKSDVNIKTSSLKKVANVKIKRWCIYLHLHVHTDTF